MVQKTRPKNKLDSPLFWIGTFGDYVLISAGGGGKNYGLPNDVKVYKNEFPVKDVVFDLDFDTELMSQFKFAYKGLNYFAAALSKFLAVFEIEPKTGALTLIKKLEADFHEKSPEVTKVKWSRDNQYIVSGGEDGAIRLFKVSYNGKTTIDGFEQEKEFGIHSEGINDVDINSENTMVVSSSTDKTWRIYSVKDEKCIKKLSFSEGFSTENLQFKGALFSPDSRFLYTLATKFKGRSYLIKWDAKDENFSPIDTAQAHNGPSWIMEINHNGKNIAIRSNDGYIIGVNTYTMAHYRSEKKHKMPVSSIMFTDDSTKILTTSPDYTYEVVNNVSKKTLCQKFVYLCVFLLLVTVFYVAIAKFLKPDRV